MERADALFHVLAALVPWKRFALSPKSRKVYQWSPSTSSGCPDLDQILAGLTDSLQVDRQAMVKGVFLNYYQNGEDYCPYHRDTLSLHGTFCSRRTGLDGQLVTHFDQVICT